MRSGVVIVEYWGMKCALKFASPKNEWTSAAFEGGVAACNA